MSFAVPTRRELAYHEAGHAYVFAALQFADVPWELKLDVDPEGNHHGHSSRQTLLYREIPFSTLSEDVLPSILRSAAKEAVIAFAGPMAEHRFGRRNHLVADIHLHLNIDKFLIPGAFDDAGDFEKIRSILAYVRASDPKASLQRVSSATSKLLDAHWRKIGALARLLDREGTLGETALEEWFEAHPAKRWDEVPSIV